MSTAVPLSVAFAAEETTTLSADAQAALDAQILSVEALVVEYQNDPAGLEAAVESLVTGATDPEVAANAVLAVFSNPQNPEIRTLLQNNAELKAAAGRGLGAAIATLGLTDPDLAARILAAVQASGDATLIAAVETGSDTKTASIKAAADKKKADTEKKDSTPENTASDN